MAGATQREAARLFVVSAAAVFSIVATSADDEVAKLDALPKPPHGLWAAADPTQLLVRSEEHAETLSVLAFVSDRFWILQRVADAVRHPAGQGFERFPDGAPRLAGTYRNWWKAHAEEDVMFTTHRSLRLWRATLDGWEPGIWTPEDIKTTPADRTFGAKLQRFGAALHSGNPA